MKIVVTGAGGNLGRAVGRELVAAGHDVLGLDKVTRAGLACPLIELDLLDAPQVLRAVAGAEVVVHLGNHIDPTGKTPDPAYTENVVMNFNVFEAARVAGAHQYLFASSVQAMTSDHRLKDPPVPSALPWLPLSGEIPLAPTNPYALSKAAGEDLLRYYVRQGLASGIALRFPKLTHEAPPESGWKWPDARRDEAFTWLTFADAARLVLAAITAAPAGFRVYFPASPRPWLAGAVEDLRKQFFSETPLRTSEPLRSFVDCRQIEQETGWSPRDL